MGARKIQNRPRSSIHSLNFHFTYFRLLSGLIRRSTRGLFVFCLVVVVRRILNPKSCGTVVQPLSLSRAAARAWTSLRIAGYGKSQVLLFTAVSAHKFGQQASIERQFSFWFGFEENLTSWYVSHLFALGFQSSSIDSWLLLSRISSNGHLSECRDSRLG
jgi:hypothetical protein